MSASQLFEPRQEGLEIVALPLGRDSLRLRETSKVQVDNAPRLRPAHREKPRNRLDRRFVVVRVSYRRQDVLPPLDRGDPRVEDRDSRTDVRGVCTGGL